MREKYESLSLTILKDIAKNRGMKGVSALKKNELIERMLELDEKTRQERIENAKKLEKEKSQKNNINNNTPTAKIRVQKPSASEGEMQEESAPVKDDLATLDSGNEVTGILEVMRGCKGGSLK